MKPILLFTLLLPLFGFNDSALLKSTNQQQIKSIRPGKDYAVFFYVTDYDDRRWPSLPDTKAECEKLAAELRDNYGFECELVPNPTKKDIRDKILAISTSTKYDQMLFFFSMHGHYDALIEKGFLIARDGNIKDVFAESWYSYDDLGNDLARNQCKHILLALDACHSGSFGIANSKAKPEPDFNEEPDCAKKIDHYLAYKTRLYFCAGSKEDKTPGQSEFAARWIDALRKGADDGIVTTNELHYQLNKLTKPKYDWGKFKGDDSGDFVFLHKNACTSQASPTKPSSLPKRAESSTDMISDFDFQRIKGGNFMMGCAEGCNTHEKPAHQVILGDFYLADHEVTQAEWRSVMGSDPPDLKFKNCNQCPVENVSWNDVQLFIQKLNALKPGKNYRLPSEAEWEFAARGGTANSNFAYAGSTQPDDVAWGCKNALPKTQPVKGKGKNELGLYDLSGNVFEWCADWYGAYPSSAKSNPMGPVTGTYKVLRGGSWQNFPAYLRVNFRYFENPDFKDSNIGFRLAKSP